MLQFLQRKNPFPHTLTLTGYAFYWAHLSTGHENWTPNEMMATLTLECERPSVSALQGVSGGRFFSSAPGRQLPGHLHVSAPCLLPDLCPVSDSASAHPQRPYGVQGVTVLDWEEA